MRNITPSHRNNRSNRKSAVSGPPAYGRHYAQATAGYFVGMNVDDMPEGKFVGTDQYGATEFKIGKVVSILEDGHDNIWLNVEMPLGEKFPNQYILRSLQVQGAAVDAVLGVTVLTQEDLAAFSGAITAPAATASPAVMAA